MDRKSALLIAVLLALALVVGFFGARAPSADFRVLSGELRRGMPLVEVVKTLKEKNMDFNVLEENGKSHILVGGETWRNFFMKENQLVLGFDEKKSLQASYVDVFYQFDEVSGDHNFPIE